MSNKNNTNPSTQIRSVLNEEDSQTDKLEENRSVNKKNSWGSLFIKDVNDSSERGHD